MRPSGRGPSERYGKGGAARAASDSVGSFDMSGNPRGLGAERGDDRDEADADPGHDRRRDQAEVADGEQVDADAPADGGAGPRPEGRGQDVSGRRPPASPRTSTYSPVCTSPTSSARGRAGGIVMRSPRRCGHGGPHGRAGACLDRSRGRARDPAAAEARPLRRTGRTPVRAPRPRPGCRSRRSICRRGRARRGEAGPDRRPDQGRPVADPDLGPERLERAAGVASAGRRAGHEGRSLERQRARLEILPASQHDRVGEPGRSGTRSAARPSATPRPLRCPTV